MGAKTAERMHKMGIFNGGQLRHTSRTHLTEVFGKAGALYHDFANGIDERPVIVERERKSVGCEQTYLEDLTRPAQFTIALYHLVIELVKRIRKADFRGRTLTLKVKYADFTQITRSITSPDMLTNKDQLLPLAKQLFRTTRQEEERAIRLLGLSVSHAIGEEDGHPHWVEGTLDFLD